MKPEPRNPLRPPADEHEVQQGGGQSRVRDDEMKRIVRQHPLRDEPRVDSVEEDEAPPP